MAHVIRGFVRVVSVSLWRATARDREALDLVEIARSAGRGHVAGDPSPLYASEEDSTAETECLNAHPYLAGTEVRFTRLAGRLAVVDVVSEEDAATCAGYTLDQLIADTWTDSQAYCALAFAHGADAVRLPSVRDRPDGVNLIVARTPALEKLSVESIEHRRV